MTIPKRNSDNFWAIFAISSFLLSNICFFILDINDETSINLYFGIYLIIYWFLPLAILVSIGKFKKRYSVVKKENLKSLSREITQNPGSVSYKSSSYSAVFFDCEKDRETELNGVYNRIVVGYYVGVLLTAFLFSYL